MVDVLANARAVFADSSDHKYVLDAERVVRRHSSELENLLSEFETHAAIRRKLPARARRERAVEGRYSPSIQLATNEETIEHASDEKHLLLLSVATLTTSLFCLLMLFSGAAVVSGYPLSYAALALTSLGLFAGLLAEWRRKRIAR